MNPGRDRERRSEGSPTRIWLFPKNHFMAEQKTDASAGSSTSRSSQTELEQEVQLERSLRRLSDRIHSSNLDEIILDLKDDISRILDAERVTIYLVDARNDEIYSKVSDGNEVEEFRVPISTESIAGYVASERTSVNIRDAYDEDELQEIDPDLSFDRTWDKRTGFRTREVLATPIVNDDDLHGVIQVVNRKTGQQFAADHLEIIRELSNSLARAISNQKRLHAQRSRWDYLLRKNIIGPELLSEATEQHQQENTPVEQVLIEEYDIDRSDVGRSLEDYFNTPYMEFDRSRPIPVELIEDLDLNMLKHHLWVPLHEEEGELSVVMADPKNIQVRDNIEAWYGGPVNYCVSTREEVISYIDYFFGLEEDEDASPGNMESDEDIDDIIGDLAEEVDTHDKNEKDDEEERKEFSQDDSAVVRLMNQIIVQGYREGASDIHLEPNNDGDFIVRFRVDGICKEYRRLPGHYSSALVSRVKIMSGLDIAERRLPQDGKIKFREYGPLDIELRVATIPTQGGKEDVVLRILAGSDFLTLDQVGMREEVYEDFVNAVNTPYGIILCVGPTGSGKTTTLHAALHHINNSEIKIWTAEDPVEITQDGLRQVQVKPGIDLTFSRAMRAFLRGDPDVIMVGEMRDKETTSTGVEASLTGHQVFSTLHTNSAPETITRLLDLGIDPFSFGDALRAILAQRLVRTFCDHCKRRLELTDEQWNKFRHEFGDDELFERWAPDSSDVVLYEATGCDACNDTGYSGRMAIHELLTSSDRIKKLVYEEARADDIKEVAQEEGMLTLKQDGILKILEGHTDLSEVHRVCIE